MFSRRLALEMAVLRDRDGGAFHPDVLRALGLVV